MQVYVINLARDVEKLKLFTSNYDKENFPKNLEFIRFEAVDGNKETLIKVHPLCDQVLCNSGTIGCAQSHLCLWKDMLAKKDRYRIIFEDDAKFDVNKLYQALQTIVQFIEQHPNKALIISLMCIGPFCNLGTNTIVGEYTFTQSIFPLSATAYIINDKAAQLLLAKMDETILYHIDFEMARIATQSNSALHYYVVTSPTVVTLHSETITSIGTTHIKSMFFGWSKRAMWYANIPVWKYGNFYTTVGILLFIILLIVSYIRNKCIYIGIALIIIIDLYIFNMS